ncbi:hypothetical protein GGR25_003493 [Kaistia hirudinis]|uniref:Uncharacterized protein n=1 Tax=Kaistia hirudinis TaxID=1293440 RepID=A0A840AVH0_9HYPH|nr:hypothetical protein [Kaistia hirudinis]
MAQGPKDPGDDVHPIAPEEGKKDKSRRQMGQNDEGQEGIVRLVEVPAEQGGDEHAMSEARYREQFSETLKKAEKNSLRE